MAFDVTLLAASDRIGRVIEIAHITGAHAPASPSVTPLSRVDAGGSLQVLLAGLSHRADSAHSPSFVDLSEAHRHSVEMVGCKAHHLGRLIELGLPVPPGVVLTSDLVGRLLKTEGTEDLSVLMGWALGEVKQRLMSTGIDWADPTTLVSVRSGAWEVVEGLLPTIQFVGLNDDNVELVARKIGSRFMAYTYYLKFVESFARDVARVPRHFFRSFKGMPRSVRGLQERITQIKYLYRDYTSLDFPEDRDVQLTLCMAAVAGSWELPRSREYRRLHGLADGPPTAVLVQRQVGDGTGAMIVYSRDLKDGGSLKGEVKVKWVTGDDVMDGSHHRPVRLADFLFDHAELGGRLRDYVSLVERVYRGPLKFEILLEKNRAGMRLWFLQAVTLGRDSMWPQARLRAAVEMCEAGLITVDEMEGMVGQETWDRLALPRYERVKAANRRETVVGVSMVPGLASGLAVFYHPAINFSDLQEGPIFLIDTIEPEDWEAILHFAVGLVVGPNAGWHFLGRAIREGVPVLRYHEPVQRLMGRIPPGSRVWLDTSRSDGFVSRGPRAIKYGPLARYLRGLVPDEDVPHLGDRARAAIGIVQRYRGLVEEARARSTEAAASPKPFKLSEFLRAIPYEDPAEVAQAILEYHRQHGAVPHLFFIGELLIQKGWAAKTMSEEREEEVYRMDNRAGAVVQVLFHTAPRTMACWFLETPMGNHALSIAIFQSLSDGDQVGLIETMVSEAHRQHRQPGWNSAYYLVARLISLWATHESPRTDLLSHLSPDALRFFGEEFFDFHWTLSNPSGAAEPEMKAAWEDERHRSSASSESRVRSIYFQQGYLAETLGRYPGLVVERLLGFCQSLSETTWVSVLDHTALSPFARDWLARRLGVEEHLPVGAIVGEGIAAPTQRAIDTTTSAGLVAELLSLENPSSETLWRVVSGRGWGTRSWDEGAERFHYQLSNELKTTLPLLLERNPSWMARLFLNSSYEHHEWLVRCFTDLSQAAQVKLLDAIVQVTDQDKRRAGFLSGGFVVSRLLFGLLTSSSWVERLMALRFETLRFAVLDLFLFHHWTGMSRDSSVQDVVTPYRSARYGSLGPLAGHEHEEEDQASRMAMARDLPHLAPVFWGPKWREFPRDSLDAVMSPLDPAVREWFLKQVA